MFPNSSQKFVSWSSLVLRQRRSVEPRVEGVGKLESGVYVRLPLLNMIVNI